MLQTMRDNSKGVVAGILVGLLVIIFALSGAEALFNSRNNNQTVLTVNGQDISQTELARAIQQQKRQMQQRFGDSLPADMLSDENLRGPALENLTERALLTQAAEDKNMAIPDQRLNQMITNTGAFQNEQGEFDPQMYQRTLRMLAFTPATYKREIARDLLIGQLSDGITSSNFVTGVELERLIDLNYQTRSFNYVTLNTESLKDAVTITDDQVTSYYESHPDEFTQPETITVEYIDLGVDQLMEDVDVSEETVKAQYEQNRESFEPNVERHAAHILLEDPTDAQVAEVQEKLDNGADFAELAKQYSDDLGSKDQGGDLGVTNGDAFPDAFEQALADLNVGGVSGPVKTDAGTHFIKLLDETGAEPKTFAEQRDQIVSQIKRTRAETRFVELLERLEDLSYNAESLKTVGGELELPVQNSEPFTRSGGPGIASQNAVVQAAFGEEVLENNNASEVIELSPDRVVVLKKIDHADSYVKPQSEVREQIVSRLRQREAAKLLAERGEALEAALKEGQSLEALAKEQQLALENADAIQRSNRDLPSSVVQFAFSMPRPEGGVRVDGMPSGQEYTVIELTDVSSPSEPLPDEQRASMQNSLASLYGSADFSAYRQYLRANAEIERQESKEP